MIPFKTVVILDLETTGLPHLEHGKTKIIEMSLIACLISHCQGGGLPRVINKLTLALNPMKMILPRTSEITGLENELLEEMKTFDDNVVSILNGFLGRLPQPLCLIAHNGSKFDFPILMKHLVKCKTKLIDNIYCADSLLAFRVILQKSVQPQGSQTKKIKDESTVSKSINIPFSEVESLEKRMSIECTPERKSVAFNAQPVKPTMHFIVSEYSNASRKLDFDNDIELIKSHNNCNKVTVNHCINQDNYSCTIRKSVVNQKNLKSYKLIDIYSYLHEGHKPNFHRSEDDCMALLSCINKCKDDFLNWLYGNASLLSDVKPLF